jgi:hypothetical protein
VSIKYGPNKRFECDLAKRRASLGASSAALCVFYTMRIVLSLLAVALSVTAHAEGWPGLAPDCWSEPRFFHGENKYDPWQKNVAVTSVKAEKPKPGVYSPNKSYFFVSQGPGRPEATITIYAEKDHLVQIRFTDLFGLSETRWINEKLLFMRPWWGKIVGTDIL